MRCGALVVGVVTLTFAACNSGVQVGKKPTTTATVAPTTTAAPAGPSTTKPAARQSTATTKPRPPVPAPPAEGQAFVVRPTDIQPFLVDPGTDYSTVSDRTFGTGPTDLDQAAADEVADGEDPREARKFLEDIGFMAGYSAAWQRRRAEGDRPNAATHLIASLYFFSTPEGAEAYFEYDGAVIEESVDPEEMEPITIGDVPGSRAWTGGNPDDGYVTVVLFACDNFYAQVVTMQTHNDYQSGRAATARVARLQYDRLA